jgi:hypothetical protein
VALFFNRRTRQSLLAFLRLAQAGKLPLHIPAFVKREVLSALEHDDLTGQKLIKLIEAAATTVAITERSVFVPEW